MADQAEGEAPSQPGKRAKLEEGQPKKGKKDKPDAVERTEEHHEEAYNAAAVLFFTRTPEGVVSKVLLATEERKVQASYIGLEQKGKVTQRMLLFPMGRREKKDKSDAVETAKREYVEETGDFGGLSKYLDFADFAGMEDGERQRPEAPEGGSGLAGDAKIWTGRQNLAMFFAPASMIMLFCEVPPEAANNTHRAAVGGVQVPDATSDDKAAPPAAPSSVKEGGKKRKKEKEKAAAAANNKKPSPTYHVGKTDHVEAAWVEASLLRDALAAKERAPRLTVAGVECRLFPVATGALRSAEARAWLGDKGACTPSDTPAAGVS